MAKRIFALNNDGFVGAYYGGPADSKKAVILMLGDSSTDHMARCGAAWLMGNGCHALCMSADKKDYGHHNYPLERFGAAIHFLRSLGMDKVGKIHPCAYEETDSYQVTSMFINHREQILRRLLEEE